MGKLAPGDGPVPVKIGHESIALPQELCDACHATEARHRVHVGDKTIYLCGHHWRKHLVHIITRGYEHKELDQ